MESTILKPTQPTQEQKIIILNSIISEAIENLNSILDLYEFKPSNKEDQDPNTLYYYFKNDNQIIKQIEILNKLLEDLKTSKDLEKTLKSYFNIKIGNIKLNDLIFNFSNSHLCYSFLNKYCSNCSICYGFK